MKSLVVAAVTAALLSGPAYAQAKMGGGGKGHRDDQKTDQQKKKPDEKTEKAYKAALDRLPDQKYDPWRGMR